MRGEILLAPTKKCRGPRRRPLPPPGSACHSPWSPSSARNARGAQLQTPPTFSRPCREGGPAYQGPLPASAGLRVQPCCHIDRKSTRLNSSHVSISYAVFCLKKKKKYNKKN